MDFPGAGGGNPAVGGNGRQRAIVPKVGPEEKILRNQTGKNPKEQALETLFKRSAHSASPGLDCYVISLSVGLAD